LASFEGEGDVSEDVGVAEFFAEVFDDEEVLGLGVLGLSAFGAPPSSLMRWKRRRVRSRGTIVIRNRTATGV
jgi:hypothetical protein